MCVPARLGCSLCFQDDLVFGTLVRGVRLGLDLVVVLAEEDPEEYLGEDREDREDLVILEEVESMAHWMVMIWVGDRWAAWAVGSLTMPFCGGCEFDETQRMKNEKMRSK